MMHGITVCIAKVAMPRKFGQSEAYHRYDSRHRLWEWSSTSTYICANGRVDSRKGGTGVPFLDCAVESRMLSHWGGTDMGLLCGRKPR